MAEPRRFRRVRCARCSRSRRRVDPSVDDCCPACGSWNAIDASDSPLLWVILFAVFAAACYVLTHPGTLTHWLGL